MITARVTGTGGVERMMRDFARIVGRTMQEEMVATARLVAVSLAASTQPYGKTNAARAAGEGAVARDVRKVFSSPSTVYEEIKGDDEDSARRFWRAFTRRDHSGMRDEMTAASIDLEIVAAPDRSMHEAARGRRGRVKGRPRQMVTQGGAIQKYIKERQKMVGFAKAGWAAAADDCGGHRGIPAWASGRHPSAPGAAQVIQSEIHPSVILKNDVSYVNEILPSGEIEAAVGIAYERLLKRLDIVTRKLARARAA